MGTELVAIDDINNSLVEVYDNIDVIDDMGSDIFDDIFSQVNNINFTNIYNGFMQINNMQAQMESETEKNEKKLEKMYSKVGKVVGAFINMKNAAKGVSSAIDYSENLMNMQTSISNMNDGSQTDEELKEKIFASSMGSRSDMGSTIATVEGLSSAGFSNNEAIQYTENLNKMFAISGTSDEAQAAATGALVDSLRDGVVSGEELNSILNETPDIVAGMAENMGLSIDEMSSLAEEGRLSADIMKNSMLGATGSINAEFENTRASWSDIMTNLGNVANVVFEPLGNKINEILNSPSFGVFIGGISSSMGAVANVLTVILDIASTVGGFIIDNWSIFGPILASIIVLITYIITVTYGFYKVQMLVKTATDLFNAAWSVCPIIIIIMAIIAAFYLVIGIINKLTGQSLSATGIIAGALWTVFAVFYNLGLSIADFFLGIVGFIANLWQTFAGFFGNLFDNPVSSIIYLFRDLAVTVLNLLMSIASIIDNIFGTNLAGTVEGWIGGVNDLADKAVEKLAPDENYEEKKKFDYTMDSIGFGRMNYGDSYNAGYDFGEGLTDFGDGLTDFGSSGIDIGSITGTSGFDSGISESDYASLMDSAGINESTMNGIDTSSYQTGENTYAISDTAGNNLNNTNELVLIGKSILSLMQQRAEKENERNVTSSVNVDLSGMNVNVRSEEDGIVFANKLAEILTEQVNGKAAGVAF